MSYSPKPKKVAYVVFIGRTVGIYESWDEAKEQVEGFAGARFKGYFTYEDATEAWEACEAGEHPLQMSPISRRARMKGPPSKRQASGVLNAVTERARMLVATFSSEHTTTCTQNQCAYPACLCR